MGTNIIGTNIPGIQKGKDHANSKDVIELMKSHDGGGDGGQEVEPYSQFTTRDYEIGES